MCLDICRPGGTHEERAYLEMKPVIRQAQAGVHNYIDPADRAA